MTGDGCQTGRGVHGWADTRVIVEQQLLSTGRCVKRQYVMSVCSSLMMSSGFDVMTLWETRVLGGRKMGCLHMHIVNRASSNLLK